MSFTQDLVAGLSEYLATTTEPPATPFAYRLTGAYSDSEFGIYEVDFPLGRNVPGLIIRPYGPAGDDPSLSDSVVSIQLEFQGPSSRVIPAADYAFDRLQGFWGGTLGTVKVQHVERVSASGFGSDETQNYKQTENYYLKVHRPSTHRQ